MTEDWNPTGQHPPLSGRPTEPGYPPQPAPQFGFPTQPPAGYPGQPTGAPAPGPAGSSGRRAGPLLLGAVLGLAVAVAVGAVLIATNTIRFGCGTTSTASADTTALNLPDSIGGLKTLTAVTAEKAKKPEQAAAQKERQARTKALTVAAYQQAYGGAAANFETYADQDLLTLVSVIAVRARSQGLAIGPIPDPADLGMATNQQSLVHPSAGLDCITY